MYNGTCVRPKRKPVQSIDGKSRGPSSGPWGTLWLAAIIDLLQPSYIRGLHPGDILQHLYCLIGGYFWSSEAQLVKCRPTVGLNLTGELTGILETQFLGMTLQSKSTESWAQVHMYYV